MAHTVLIPFRHNGKDLKKDETIELKGKAAQTYEKLGFVEAAKAKAASKAASKEATKSDFNPEK